MVHLLTLGAASIRIGSAHVGPGSGRKFGALLFLAAQRGRHISRDTLHTFLFPDNPGKKGLHCVRQLIYDLRLRGAPLHGKADTVVLPSRFVEDDYSSLFSGEMSDAVLGQIAGGFLPGFLPSFSEAYTEWFDQFRGEVTLRLRHRLVEQLVQMRLNGNVDRRARLARACLALDPLNEEATLGLAEVLALSGSKAEAVQLLDGFLAEVGGGPDELKMPAALLRRRIAERLPEPSYRAVPQPPMVGRASEITELTRYLRRAQGGRPQTVVVSGEAGIGKSRLVAEFAKLAVLQGAVVRTVMLQPHDQRRPMAVFMDLIPQLRELPGALGCAPDALQLLDRVVATEPSSGTTISGVYANVTRALDELIEAVSSEAPLILVVEDGQWSDEMSMNTLVDLMAAHRHSRLLIIVTSRDQRLFSSSPEHLPISLLSIGALGEPSARALLDHILHACDCELIDWVVCNGGGNPFFLVALASHYVATQERFAVPASLSELLAKRLDHLDNDAATVFDACVLLGKHSTLRRLLAVLDTPAIHLAGVLRRLEIDSLIVDVGGCVRSTHDLISDIAMSRAPSAARRLLHARIARVLESDEAAKDSLLWDAAEHWAASGAPQSAVAILETSADRAQTVHQVQHATELLKRAFDLADDTEEKRRLAARLIDCASHAEDWLRVQDAMRWLRNTCGDTEHSNHDRFELVEHEAEYHLGGARPALVAALRQCLSSNVGGPEHRMHAARRLLTLADEAMDPDSAEDLRSITQRIPSYEGRDFDQLHFEMLYEALFGDRSRASSLADRLVRKYPFDLSNRPRIIAHNNAVLAVYRGGHMSVAEDRAREQYLVSLRCSAPEPAFWAASIIAGINIDRGDLAEGHHWSDLADNARMGTNFALLRSGYLGNKLRLAILEQRPSDARVCLQMLTNQYQASSTGRLRVVAISDSMRVRQLEGRPPNDDQDLVALLDSHKAACRVGMHDDVVATIWYALDERGRGKEANAFLRHYLHHERYDLYPPAEEISQIMRTERFLRD